MLRHVLVVGLLIGSAAVGFAKPALERDYLYRGDEQSPRWYDRAVRHVLGRAWHSDVVLRTIAFHPFDREAVVGILRTADGYSGFVMRPSQQIYNAPGNLGAGYLARLRSTLQQRSLDARLVTRMTSLWRKVLENPRNYGTRKDPEPNRDGSRTIILDMTYFSYSVRPPVGAQVTASMDGWGPQTDEIIKVTEALQSFVERRNADAALIRALANAERRLTSN